NVCHASPSAHPTGQHAVSTMETDQISELDRFVYRIIYLQEPVVVYNQSDDIAVTLTVGPRSIWCFTLQRRNNHPIVIILERSVVVVGIPRGADSWPFAPSDQFVSGARMSARHRIAVVDDDLSVRKALCRLLRSLDVEAEAYGSGQAFLDALKSTMP